MGKIYSVGMAKNRFDVAPSEKPKGSGYTTARGSLCISTFSISAT